MNFIKIPGAVLFRSFDVEEEPGMTGMNIGWDGAINQKGSGECGRHIRGRWQSVEFMLISSSFNPTPTEEVAGVCVASIVGWAAEDDYDSLMSVARSVCNEAGTGRIRRSCFHSVIALDAE